MPGVSKEQRAEAKYNVVLDFPHLGLHNAAATGNLALVKYALDHGQPINSALDGLLPLHCACFGGNDTVVRELIAHGADVNSPRLPRRYATVKNRGAEPPLSIPGSSGSTPLHFACMGGHTAIVLTLLLHGAHPDRPDKHGVTPETIARQNGYTTCADVLREWTHNKDKDLREREALISPATSDQTSKEKEPHSYCGSLECLECATRKRIRMKRSIDSAIHILRHSSSHSSNFVTPPHSAGPTVISTPQPPTPTEKPFGEYSFYPSPDPTLGPPAPRRPSLPHALEATRVIPTSQRSRRMSNLSTTSARRPRSAGSDADQSYPSSNQKVKGKISLLSIFKKANASDSNPSSTVASTSVSPAPPSILALASSPPSTEALSVTPPNPPHDLLKAHHRVFSDTTPHRSPLHTSELHRSPSREGLEGSTPISINDSSATAPSARPGILRSHGRSSSGQSGPSGDSTPPPSGRSLRFDSTSSGRQLHVHDTRQMSRSPPRTIRGAGSGNSLRSRSPGSPWRKHREGEMTNLSASPVLMGTQEKLCEGQIEEEEEYGSPVEPHVGIDNNDDKDSIDSPTSSRSKKCGFRCPFSINSPPPEASPPADDKFLGTGLDGRLRGNSLSSMGTDSSITTPALQHPSLPQPIIASPSYSPTGLPSPDDVTREELIVEKKQEPVVTSIATPEKRPRVPLDIDIRTISTHAQAEALVQLAQKRILDMDSDIDDEECRALGALGVSLGEGRTPLSARLAAYGEVLAIERKFKEEEENKRRSLVLGSSSPLSEEPTPVGNSRSSTLDRKFSLQERNKAEGEIKRLRRMHSAGGNSLSDPSESTVFLTAEPEETSLSRSNPEHSSGRLHPDSYTAASSLSSLTPPSRSDLRATTLPSRAQVPRSRTPDPDYSGHGAPLSRYSTCPLEESFNDLVPRRIVSAQERQAARAQKLAKMGFAGANDSYRESSQSRAQQRSHRFGGIRNLVHTLTGRT